MAESKILTVRLENNAAGSTHNNQPIELKIEIPELSEFSKTLKDVGKKYQESFIADEKNFQKFTEGMRRAQAGPSPWARGSEIEKSAFELLAQRRAKLIESESTLSNVLTKQNITTASIAKNLQNSAQSAETLGKNNLNQMRQGFDLQKALNEQVSKALQRTHPLVAGGSGGKGGSGPGSPTGGTTGTGEPSDPGESGRKKSSFFGRMIGPIGATLSNIGSGIATDMKISASQASMLVGLSGVQGSSIAAYQELGDYALQKKSNYGSVGGGILGGIAGGMLGSLLPFGSGSLVGSVVGSHVGSSIGSAIPAYLEQAQIESAKRQVTQSWMQRRFAASGLNGNSLSRYATNLDVPAYADFAQGFGSRNFGSTGIDPRTLSLFANTFDLTNTRALGATAGGFASRGLTPAALFSRTQQLSAQYGTSDVQGTLDQALALTQTSGMSPEQALRSSFSTQQLGPGFASAQASYYATGQLNRFQQNFISKNLFGFSSEGYMQGNPSDLARGNQLRTAGERAISAGSNANADDLLALFSGVPLRTPALQSTGASAPMADFTTPEQHLRNMQQGDLDKNANMSLAEALSHLDGSFSNLGRIIDKLTTALNQNVNKSGTNGYIN